MSNQEMDNSENGDMEEFRNDSSPQSESTLESIEESSNDVASITSTTSISSFSGPLPHPEILARYEEVLPGAAERIFTNAESQSAHRRKVEMTLLETATSSVKHESNRAYLGLASGTIAAIILILCGTVLVYNGHDWAGTTLVVATIVGLVGAFVYSTQTRSAERRQSLYEADYAPEPDEGE